MNAGRKVSVEMGPAGISLAVEREDGDGRDLFEVSPEAALDMAACFFFACICETEDPDGLTRRFGKAIETKAEAYRKARDLFEARQATAPTKGRPS